MEENNKKQEAAPCARSAHSLQRGILWSANKDVQRVDSHGQEAGWTGTAHYIASTQVIVIRGFPAALSPSLPLSDRR